MPWSEKLEVAPVVAAATADALVPGSDCKSPDQVDGTGLGEPSVKVVEAAVDPLALAGQP